MKELALTQFETFWESLLWEGRGSTIAYHSTAKSSRKIFSEKIVDVAVVNQRRRLEESGQWLENVDQTHLDLASGKPVLQKFALQLFLFTFSARRRERIKIRCRMNQIFGLG